MQNRVATRVNIVQTRASFTKNAHGGGVLGERRRLNGVAKRWVTSVDVGAAIKKQLDYVAATEVCCQGERPVAGALRSRVLVEEVSDQLEVTEADGPRERRLTDPLQVVCQDLVD
jgi:hypothetical protein